MDDSNLEHLVTQGLSAMKAGSDVAARATSEIQDDVSHPDLRRALEEGERTSKQWADRIDTAQRDAGKGDVGDNPVLEAHYEVSRRIRQEAQDETTRDLGIIASGQLALHYWIASFGTMASYLKACDKQDGAQAMAQSADEAKAADEKMTALAQAILRG